MNDSDDDGLCDGDSNLKNEIQNRIFKTAVQINLDLRN